MASKPVALLLADLGVTKTHSRPHISNDNPFSEAHFKTFKNRTGFRPTIWRHRGRAPSQRMPLAGHPARDTTDFVTFPRFLIIVHTNAARPSLRRH
jgi:hypothetical protein